MFLLRHAIHILSLLCVTLWKHDLIKHIGVDVSFVCSNVQDQWLWLGMEDNIPPS
jgi:hypothetical protein